jgi:hypothetical protein
MTAERAGPGVQVGDVGAGAAIPEPPERRAALVGREAAPQQLAGQLMVRPDHQCLHEPGVGLQHGQRVRLDLADAGQEPGRLHPGEIGVQRYVDPRRDHDPVAGRREPDRIARRVQCGRVRRGRVRRSGVPEGDHARHPARHGHPWIRPLQQGGADRAHAERHERRRRPPDHDLVLGHLRDRRPQPLDRVPVGDPVRRPDRAEQVVHRVPRRPDLLAQVPRSLQVPLAEHAGSQIVAVHQPRVRVGRDPGRVGADLVDQSGRHRDRHADRGQVDRVGVRVERQRRHRRDAEQGVRHELGRFDRQPVGRHRQPADHPDPRLRTGHAGPGRRRAQHRSLWTGQPPQRRIVGGVGQAGAADRRGHRDVAAPGAAVQRRGQLQQAILGQRGEVPVVDPGQRLHRQPEPAQQPVRLQDLVDLFPAPLHELVLVLPDDLGAESGRGPGPWVQVQLAEPVRLVVRHGVPPGGPSAVQRWSEDRGGRVVPGRGPLRRGVERGAQRRTELPRDVGQLTTAACPGTQGAVQLDIRGRITRRPGRQVGTGRPQVERFTTGGRRHRERPQPPGQRLEVITRPGAELPAVVDRQGHLAAAGRRPGRPQHRTGRFAAETPHDPGIERRDEAGRVTVVRLQPARRQQPGHVHRRPRGHGGRWVLSVRPEQLDVRPGPRLRQVRQLRGDERTRDLQYR